MLENSEIPQEISSALRDIRNKCKTEDSYVRYAQVRAWKKAEEFWHGLQYIYWSETGHEWRTPDNIASGDLSDEERDSAGPYYDYVINIYKAHGESVIAALSQELPVVEFFPDDADEVSDISSAKTKTKIGLLIQKHNRAKLIIMEALFKLFNSGLVIGFVYNKADKSYGTRKRPVYGKEKFNMQYDDCPMCATRMGEHQEEMNEIQCPTCQYQGVPSVAMEQEERIVQTGNEDVPKNRTCIEVFGPLNFKVPYYARESKDFGYVLQFIETHYALVRDTYPKLREKIKADFALSDTDRWTRTPSTFAAAPRTVATEASLITVEKLWLRPWMFEMIDDITVVEKLKTDFPEGCKIVFIGEEIAELVAEGMDEYLEFGKSGPSTYIHSDGIGSSLMPVQEMRNTCVNLGIETIEHGIPTGFADPSVLNFDEYSQKEVRPGDIFPARAPGGRRLDEFFYEEKTATLSKEVQPFVQQLDQDGQFVTGSFPSIYGGPTASSSRTASEYDMSRKQALQRLSLTWEYLRLWWTGLINKAVNCFIKNMVEDERYVVMEASALYTNVMIRQADLIGKSNVEPEASEHFPITSSEKKSVLMELIQLQNEGIQEIMGHPENLSVIADAIGFPDLYIPNDDQRFKQLSEISELIKVDPNEVPESFPTVPTEPTVDEEEIHVQICKVFLASERGQDLKKVNPNAYLNVMAHNEMHQQSLQAQALQQSMMQMPEQAPTENQNV
jgi:hypothetical protein